MSVVLSKYWGSSEYKHWLSVPLMLVRPFTLIAWAKKSSDFYEYYRCIAELYNHIDTSYVSVLYGCYSPEKLAVYQRNAGSARLLISSGDFNNDDWCHVGCSSASGSDRSLWLNGVKYTQETDCGDGTAAFLRLTLGQVRWNPSIGYPFVGKIAHVALWDIVLDDADIQALAAKSVKPHKVERDHLIGYWRLIDGPEAFVGSDLTEEGYTDYISYDPGDDPLLEWYAPFYGFSQFTPVLSCLTLAPAWQPWTWPVTETLLFPTQILQSHDRTEQRIAGRRKVPEQIYQTRLAVWGDRQAAELESAAHRWLKRPWPVPVWPESCRLSAALPAGSASVAVDTRYASYRAGGYALLWSRTRREIVQVDSVADGAITLGAATAQAWSPGDWVMPLRLGRIVSSCVVERFPGGALLQIQVRVTDTEAVTGFVADQTYDGMTVLTSPTLWPGGVGQGSHDPDVAVLESGSGPFEIVSNSEYNDSVQTHSWQCATPAQVWALRQFLHEIAGRQKAFLVPTFRRDLTLSRAVGSSDTEIYLEAGPFASNMDGNSLRTYVAFRSGESLIVRKVSSITVVSTDEEKMTLDAGPGQVFAAGQALCWVDRCRLAEDTVQFDWRSNRVATCNVTLTRVF